MVVNAFVEAGGVCTAGKTMNGDAAAPSAHKGETSHGRVSRPRTAVRAIPVLTTAHRGIRRPGYTHTHARTCHSTPSPQPPPAATRLFYWPTLPRPEFRPRPKTPRRGQRPPAAATPAPPRDASVICNGCLATRRLRSTRGFHNASARRCRQHPGDWAGGGGLIAVRQRRHRSTPEPRYRCTRV